MDDKPKKKRQYHFSRKQLKIIKERRDKKKRRFKRRNPRNRPMKPVGQAVPIGDTEVEEWKKIPGFNYSVSSLGRIRRDRYLGILYREKNGKKYRNKYMHFEKIRKPVKGPDGDYVTLKWRSPSRPNKRGEKKFFIRILVADAFVLPRGYGQVINVDGDRSNNRPINLKRIPFHRGKLLPDVKQQIVREFMLRGAERNVIPTIAKRYNVSIITVKVLIDKQVKRCGT